MRWHFHALIRSCKGTPMHKYIHEQILSCKFTFMHRYIHAQVCSCTGTFMHVHTYKRTVHLQKHIVLYMCVLCSFHCLNLVFFAFSVFLFSLVTFYCFLLFTFVAICLFRFYAKNQQKKVFCVLKGHKFSVFVSFCRYKATWTAHPSLDSDPNSDPDPYWDQCRTETLYNKLQWFCNATAIF
jgi:hypothetical protein